MCQFFSFISNGEGKFYYFNWEQRQDMTIYGSPDSHTTLADYFKPCKKGKDQAYDDVVNKYEYNPFTKVFVKDQINVLDDSKQAGKWVRGLDFKEICPIIDFNKDFKEPLNIKREGTEVNKFEIQLLKEWDQLGDQLRDQLWDQLGDQLGDQLWDQLGEQLWEQLYSFGTTFVKDFKFKNKKQEELVNCINSLWLLGLMPLKINNNLCLYTLSTCECIYAEII